MEIWKYGKMEIWIYGHMEKWIYGYQSPVLISCSYLKVRISIFRGDNLSRSHFFTHSVSHSKSCLILSIIPYQEYLRRMSGKSKAHLRHILGISHAKLLTFCTFSSFLKFYKFFCIFSDSEKLKTSSKCSHIKCLQDIQTFPNTLNLKITLKNVLNKS